MDYSGYTQFPFPDRLSGEERQLKERFLALTDERQLTLLQGCQSYFEFRTRLADTLSGN